MRHRSSTTHLGRNRSERTQLLRDLSNALVLHGSITTTKQKAQFVRPYVERAITISKKGDLAAKRRLHSLIYNKDAEKKLRDELSSTYAARPGGYTRVVKLGKRQGDSADMVRLELV